MSIWADGRFLYFSDVPWVLCEAPLSSNPALLQVVDLRGLDGPIFVRLVNELMSASDVGSGPDIGDVTFDNEMTGGRFVISLARKSQAQPLVVRVKLLKDGIESEYGHLALVDGEYGLIKVGKLPSSLPSRQ